MTTVSIVITSGTSWTVPADFTSINSVEVWGGGGLGLYSGGGGGGYAKIQNLNLTPGSIIQYSVGPGGYDVSNRTGTNTVFGGSNISGPGVYIYATGGEPTTNINTGGFGGTGGVGPAGSSYTTFTASGGRAAGATGIGLPNSNSGGGAGGPNGNGRDSTNTLTSSLSAIPGWVDDGGEWFPPGGAGGTSSDRSYGGPSKDGGQPGGNGTDAANGTHGSGGGGNGGDERFGGGKPGGAGGLFGGGAGSPLSSNYGIGGHGGIVIVYESQSGLKHRLTSLGNFLTNTEFDEVTSSFYSEGSSYIRSAEFDEITHSGATSFARRITNSGTVFISGEFDEQTGIS
jgi:hypothetical protein